MKTKVQSKKREAFFLSGSPGRAVLDEVQWKVKNVYENNEALNIFSYEEGVVMGSNPYFAVLVNEVANKLGLRIPNLSDLNEIIETDSLDLWGKCVDVALVLRAGGEPNAYLASDLAYKVVEKEGRFRYPAMISLSDLELEKNHNAPHGLSFKLKEDSQIMHAPILNSVSGYFNCKNIDEKTGLPRKLERGGGRGRDYLRSEKRYMHSRSFGLSSLYLNGHFDLNSSNTRLHLSSEDGRVVLVKW